MELVAPVRLGGSELLLGGRCRRAFQPGFTCQSSAGFRYQTVSAFVAGDDGLEEARQGPPALQVSGGLVLDRGPYHASMQGGGSFKPLPTGLHYEMLLGYEVAPGIAVQGMYTLASRVGTVSADDYDILVIEGVRGYRIGVAYALPCFSFREVELSGHQSGPYGDAPASGKAVCFKAALVFAFDVSEDQPVLLGERVYYDNLTVLQQFGVVPTQ